jgi:hypothetical protein
MSAKSLCVRARHRQCRGAHPQRVSRPRSKRARCQWKSAASALAAAARAGSAASPPSPNGSPPAASACRRPRTVELHEEEAVAVSAFDGRQPNLLLLN